MKIAIGGLNKPQMEAAIKKACPDIETVITTDMGAVPMLKSGEVDYYIGGCESGGGAAIAILIGLIGYSRCCTVCKNGGKPDIDEMRKFIDEGKIVFGLTVEMIDQTVPLLIQALLEKNQ